MNAIGQPISRLEGRLKTTGAARYTADLPIADVVHGVIVQSTIANGRTVSIDTRAAEKAPGVLAVFTHRNLPRMNPTPKPWSHLHPQGQSYLPLQDDQILYANQPVALVVATTRDQAAYAGTLIGIQYESSPPAVFDRPAANEAVKPPQFLWPAAAAKVLNRPVHVQLTRAQMYSMTGHQCASMQVIRLGADRNGKLNGIRHDSVTPTSMFDNYIEYAHLCPRP